MLDFLIEVAMYAMHNLTVITPKISSVLTKPFGTKKHSSILSISRKCIKWYQPTFNHHFFKVIQYPGDFVITGYCYHSGFNVGFNIAEAVNFGSQRWPEMYEKFEVCNCRYVVCIKHVFFFFVHHIYTQQSV